MVEPTRSNLEVDICGAAAAAAAAAAVRRKGESDDDDDEGEGQEDERYFYRRVLERVWGRTPGTGTSTSCYK